MGVVIAILAVGVLIIVHEAGHYFVARWCKMRVDRFSVGFGPAIFSKTYDGTDFTVGPIPFGGFVQIHGMLIQEDVEEGDETAYPNRPTWQRFLTIFAGPATNYLFAIVIGLFLFNTAGIPHPHKIRDVSSDLDAHEKLLPGDLIVAINGEAPTESIASIVGKSEGAPLMVSVMREGQKVDVSVTPKLVPPTKEGGKPAYLMGIALYGFEPTTVGNAVGSAFLYPVDRTQFILSQLSQIITGRAEGEFLGPVGITGQIKKSYDLGWPDFLALLMMLNVYLGLFNLLPLPALDGGRLAFLGYELATRRRPNPKIEATVHMVGIMALFVVLILVTYKDIAKLF